MSAIWAMWMLVNREKLVLIPIQIGDAMKRFAWVMGLLGVVAMAIGIGLFAQTWLYLDRSQMLPGVVTELVISSQKGVSKRYKSRVQFETPSGDRVNMLSRLGSAPAAHRIGDPVEVYFDPANPSDARLNGFLELWGIASVAAGLGLVFFLVGAGLGVAKRFNAQKLARLRGAGDLVLATLDKVEIDTSTTFNDHHPWRVHAHWDDPVSGQRHLFASEMLWQDPSARLGQSPVQVYIERGNPRRYAMDLPQT